LRKFIYQILFFSIALIIALQIVNLFKPYYWGNKVFEQKLIHVRNETKVFNTLFFGSSHIYRQINPIVFDKHSKGKTQSFNFGAVAVYGIESLYLMENYLASNLANDIDYVLIEYQHSKRISNRNLKSFRGFYYLDFKSLVKAFSIFKDNKAILVNYIKGFLLNKLNYQSTFFHKSRLTKAVKISLSDAGYLSLNKEMKFFKSKRLNKRSKAYKKSQKEILKTFHQNANGQYDIANNRFYLEILKLSNKFPEIQFVVLNHPLNKPIISNIEPNKVPIISLNSEEMKQLISDNKNIFDKGHLSQKGAKWYSRKISTKFNSIFDAKKYSTSTKFNLQNKTLLNLSKLKKLDQNTKSQIFRINDNKTRIFKNQHTTIKVKRKKINITGYAIDAVNNDLANDVYIEISGQLFPTNYGTKKPTVAKRLGGNHLLNCGFSSQIEVQKLKKGLNHLNLVIIDKFSSGYFKSKKPIKLMVEK